MPKEVYATTPQVTVKREPIKGPAPPQRVTIYAKDGSPYEVYQIDAREILAGGEYFSEPPAKQPVPSEPEAAVSDAVDSVQPRRGRPPRQSEGEAPVLRG